MISYTPRPIPITPIEDRIRRIDSELERYPPHEVMSNHALKKFRALQTERRILIWVLSLRKPPPSTLYECLMCGEQFDTTTGPGKMHMARKHGRNLKWALETGKAVRIERSRIKVRPFERTIEQSPRGEG